MFHKTFFFLPGGRSVEIAEISNPGNPVARGKRKTCGGGQRGYTASFYFEVPEGIVCLSGRNAQSFLRIRRQAPRFQDERVYRHGFWPLLGVSADTPAKTPSKTVSTDTIP